MSMLEEEIEGADLSDILACLEKRFKYVSPNDCNVHRASNDLTDEQKAVAIYKIIKEYEE